MSAPILVLNRLSMAFGGVQALADVSFDVAEGSITALIGPNGAGKTTAVNCLSGVYRPQQGQAFLFGQQVMGFSTHHLARVGVTRTFQNLQVFGEMTVLENVMLGLHHATKREFVWALFRLPGLWAEEREIRRRAEGMLEELDLTDIAGAPAGQLAYGDQKRVELARALVGKPRLVLLDEPVAGLNSAETEQMAAYVRRARDQGVTVLLVEHDMNLVMGISDQVVVLNYGRKLAQGTPAQMQCHPEVIEAYLGSGESEVDGA